MSSKSPLRTERLRQLRKVHGLSQRELARLCGFGDTQVRKYESGQTDPSARSLKLMADQLQVSADYLLGISDNPRGQINSSDLSDDELAVIDTLRRDGWPGVIRLGADRLSNGS